MSVSTLAENYIGLSVTPEFVEWETRRESHTAVNAPECLARLAAALACETEPPHVVCELAGGAERVVVAFLLADGYRVSLAEPETVCAFAGIDGAEAAVGFRGGLAYGLCRLQGRFHHRVSRWPAQHPDRPPNQ